MPKKFLEKFLERIEKVDRKKVEKILLSLEDQSDFFRKILDSINEAIIVVGREIRIEYLNKQATDILSTLSMKSVGKPLSEYIIDREFLKFLEEKITRRERIAGENIEVFTPKEMILDVSVIPLSDEDNVDIGTIIALSDITEKGLKETQDIRSRRLSSLGLLASGIAHEIGNPLNSIGIHLQLAFKELEALQKKSKEKIGQSLTVIAEEIKRLDHIVSQFLRAVRPIRPNFEEIDVVEVLDRTIDFMSGEVFSHNISIEKNYTPKRCVTLIDESQIKQAFFNIMKNSIEAMSEGGKILISTEKKGKNIKIHFSDGGAGIDEEKIEKIFEPYFTTKESGAGLGLMIVDRIIREHEGTVKVESKEGEGAKVTISLPVRSKQIRLIPRKIKL